MFLLMLNPLLIEVNPYLQLSWLAQ